MLREGRALVKENDFALHRVSGVPFDEVEEVFPLSGEEYPVLVLGHLLDFEVGGDCLHHEVNVV